MCYCVTNKVSDMDIQKASSQKYKPNNDIRTSTYEAKTHLLLRQRRLCLLESLLNRSKSTAALPLQFNVQCYHPLQPLKTQERSARPPCTIAAHPPCTTAARPLCTTAARPTLVVRRCLNLHISCLNQILT